MSAQNEGNTKQEQGSQQSERPATQATTGSKNDPRFKALDAVEDDNEKKLGEKNLDSKIDKSAG